MHVFIVYITLILIQSLFLGLRLLIFAALIFPALCIFKNLFTKCSLNTSDLILVLNTYHKVSKEIMWIALSTHFVTISRLVIIKYYFLKSVLFHEKLHLIKIKWNIGFSQEQGRFFMNLSSVVFSWKWITKNILLWNLWR